MLRFTVFHLQLLLLASLLVGCKKDETTEEPNTEPPPAASSADVYVTGAENVGGIMVAKVWRNGTESTLPSTSQSTHTRDIDVASGDVHVVGYHTTQVDNQLVFRRDHWINGVPQSQVLDTVYGVYIPEGNTSMRKRFYEQSIAVFLDGADVYTCYTRKVVHTEFGNTVLDSTYAMYAKNDETHGLGDGQVTDIHVANGDVYVTGRKGDRALYWKNGVEHFLTDGSIGQATAMSIAVVGGVVYVAGYENHSGQNKAKVWTNGTESVLTVGTNTEEALGIAVSGGVVYVCGLEHTVPGGSKSAAKLWTNGVAQNLTDGTASKAQAFGVAVNGSDVFVTGQEQIILGNDNFIRVWKNGVASTLNAGSDNLGGKTAIKVVPL